MLIIELSILLRFLMYSLSGVAMLKVHVASGLQMAAMYRPRARPATKSAMVALFRSSSRSFFM